MGALGKKLRGLEGGSVAFLCPGCNELHAVRIRKGAPDGRPSWIYNGNADRPTFSASILVRGIHSPTGDMMTEDEEAEYDGIMKAGGVDAVLSSRFGTVCHSFVEDGKIRFLHDCTHALAGQTVELPDIDSNQVEPL